MLIRNSALYVVAKLLPGGLGMLTTAVLTRLLPPDSYGRYGVALVIMSFGASLGFEWLGLAYLRLAPSAGPGATGTFDRLFLMLLAVAAVIGGVVLATVPPADRVIVAAGLLLMASYAWFEFRTRFHVAGIAPGAYFRMNLARAVLVMLSAIAAAWSTHDPACTALATAAATLVAASRTGAREAQGGGFDRALALAAIRFGLPLAASLMLNSAMGSLTRGLVGAFGGIEALGLFTAAFVLVQNTLVVLSSGLSSAGFSLTVNALEAGHVEAARRQLAANFTLLLAILAPAALGMALTADALAAVLVGPGFRATVAQLTPWLAAAAFLTGLRSHYLDHAFHLGRRMRGQVGVTAVAAIVTLGLDALLIPRLGPVGAGIALTVGAAVAAIHAAIAGRAAFVIPLPAGPAIRTALGCAVLAACVLSVPGSGAAALAGKVLAGVVGYGAAALALDIAGLRRTAARRLRRAGIVAGGVA